MSSAKRQRRAFPANEKDSHKDAITTAAGGAKGPAHMQSSALEPMRLERTKVFGVIEQDTKGQLYLSKMTSADADDDGEAELDTTKSVGEAEETGVEWVCPIVKADEDQRLVTGIVLEPEVVDAQFDIYNSDVIQKAAHEFLREWNAGTVVGYMHKDMHKSLDVVESYCAPVNMTIGETKIKKGTWLMTVYVADEKVWKQVKNGEIAGFSIGGIAKVQRLETDDAAE